MILLSTAVAAENLYKEVSGSFKVTKDHQLVIIGEMDVTIENWDKDEIAIDALLDIDHKYAFKLESDGEYNITIEEKDNIITIKKHIPKKRVYIGVIGSDKSRVTISMPEWIDLTTDIDDANLYAESLSGNIDIKGDDGSVVINSIDSRVVKIRYGDGSLNIDELSATKATISYDDGSANLGDISANKFVVKFNDGSFRGNLTDNCKNVFVEYDDGSASLNLQNPMQFYFIIDKDDGSIRNLSELEISKLTDARFQLGNVTADVKVQVWFNDGSLRISD
jgi:hypothetical protein